MDPVTTLASLRTDSSVHPDGTGDECLVDRRRSIDCIHTPIQSLADHLIHRISMVSDVVASVP